MDRSYRGIRDKCRAKFRTTKKNKYKFKTDENDAILEGKWGLPWASIFPQKSEPKSDSGLPKPIGKSRQSILSATSVNKGPPSLKKGSGLQNIS